MKKTLLLLSLIIIQATIVSAFEYNGRHGWPEQKKPKNVLVCTPGQDVRESMLLESLSGLAAQAVNEGKFDEMVWTKTSNPSYVQIYNNTIAELNNPQIKEMDVWTLLEYLKKKGVVKGYVLYKLDAPRENAYAAYPDIDYSSNVATVYASLLKGVLIDESLVAKAKSYGLKQLKDARHESLEECFEKNKSKLNNCSALSVPATVTNLRDYAIAQKLMLYADKHELIEKVLEWVKPLSPILGWGCGDEYDFTSVISRWGHYNTASNWCVNLPIISSVASTIELKKINEVDPSQINFADTSAFHTFVMSDGDNMQWTMGAFIHNPCYLGHKDLHNVGMSWTLCPTNLSVISPTTWNSIANLQSNNLSFLEYGGGYQYPDLFAIDRPNREELLREFARRMNYHMNKLGITIFGFICRDVAGPDAQRAFQIYAEEMENITGMLAVQYAPYELEGQTYWMKNKQGVEIPVMTSRYSIWDEITDFRPRAGAPEFVASLINRDVSVQQKEGDQPLSWTIVHAWSDFAKSSKVSGNPAIGVNPVIGCENLLTNNIKTISANELLWRVRMKYKPEQTKALIESKR